MTDRSIVTAWVVLAASLVALVALFDWAFVHVVGRAASPVTGTGAIGPVSGVHGTAARPDARVAPVLEGSASKAVSSASAGGAVAESVPVSPAGGDGDLAVAEAPGAATAKIGSPIVEAAEDVPVGVVGDGSVEAAGGVIEEHADGDLTADASIDDATAIGETVRDAVLDTDAMDGPVDNTAAEGPADADADTDADLEALRRLLAEATAIEAAAEPFGAGAGTSAERTVSGGDTSRRAPSTVPGDLAEGIRFESRSTTFGRDATTALDELAALLAGRPHLTVTVGVTVDEFGDDTRDRVLGRERGRAIIAGLVARGVAFERLSLSEDDDGASPSGSHRVRIVVDTDG